MPIIGTVLVVTVSAAIIGLAGVLTFAHLVEQGLEALEDAFDV